MTAFTLGNRSFRNGAASQVSAAAAVQHEVQQNEDLKDARRSAGVPTQEETGQAPRL